MSVLTLHNVSKTYGAAPTAVRALDGVSLDIPVGQTVALAGASGSGKTTLLNVAAGLDRASEGTVCLAGRDLADASERALALLRRRTVGFVFQSLNLVSTLTAGENVELAMALAGQGREARRTRAADLLSRGGLADRAGAFPDELSAGQRQRIAALRAVAHRPDLVLMDEPTSCLDTENANRLVDLLLELNRCENTTIVLATHDSRISDRLGRTVRLRDGRIVDDC